LSILIIESCQDKQKSNLVLPSKVVLHDLHDFPNKPFNQINFSNSESENQTVLLNNGFVFMDNNSFYRSKDSTTIFLDDSFDIFTVYLKSNKLLNQSKSLYDLLKSNSSQSNGSLTFTEFIIDISKSNNYSITFFKTVKFIRLKYQRFK